MNVKKARMLWKILLFAGALITMSGKYWLPLLFVGFITMLGGIFVVLRYYKCPHCRKTLGGDNGDFCPYCGEPLDK